EVICSHAYESESYRCHQRANRIRVQRFATVLRHRGAFRRRSVAAIVAAFFRQAEGEKGHALRFIKYVVDAGGRVIIPAIDAPKSKFNTARDAVKLSLDQE